MIRILILSVILMITTSCATRGQTTALGSIIGAGAGAVIGHQQGRAGEGALIGAGAGAIIGYLSHQDREQEPQRTRTIYVERETHRHHHGRRYFYDCHGCKIYIDRHGHCSGCSVINPYKRRRYNPMRR